MLLDTGISSTLGTKRPFLNPGLINGRRRQLLSTPMHVITTAAAQHMSPHLAVAVRKRRHELPEVGACLVLSQPPALRHLAVQRPPWSVLRDHRQVVLRDEGLREQANGLRGGVAGGAL